MMFLSTSGLNQSYILKGIVNATVKRTLKAEELDEVDQFDNLYAQVQKKLENKALELDADGVIDIRFVPQIVRVSVGPKYMLLHGYGTAISFPNYYCSCLRGGIGRRATFRSLFGFPSASSTLVGGISINFY